MSLELSTGNMRVVPGFLVFKFGFFGLFPKWQVGDLPHLQLHPFQLAV